MQGSNKQGGALARLSGNFHISTPLSYPTVMPLLNGRSFSPFNPTYGPFGALKTIFSFTIALLSIDRVPWKTYLEKKYIVIFGHKSVSYQDLQKQHLYYSELSYLWMYTFCTLVAQQREAHYFAIIPNYSATLHLFFFQNRDIVQRIWLVGFVL